MCAPDRPRLFRRGCQERGKDVIEIGQWVADCAHLPIQDTNDPWFCPVEDDVVDFVVTVYERSAVLRLRGNVAEEVDHVVLVRDFADGYAGLFVFGFSLGF